MDDALGVRLAQAAQDLLDGVEGGVMGQGAVLLEPEAQVHAAQVLHDDIEHALSGLTVVIEGDGVGVAQAAGVEDLAAKALDLIGLGVGLGAQHLDGDVAAHGVLECFKHDAIAALTELGVEAIFASDEVPDLGQEVGHRRALPGSTGARLRGETKTGDASELKDDIVRPFARRCKRPQRAPQRHRRASRVG